MEAERARLAQQAAEAFSESAQRQVEECVQRERAALRRRIAERVAKERELKRKAEEEKRIKQEERDRVGRRLPDLSV